MITSSPVIIPPLATGLQTPYQDGPVFSFDKWDPALPRLANEYRGNRPFPHIHLTEFLEPTAAERIHGEFPDPSNAQWLHYKHYNEDKLGMAHRDGFPAATGALVDILQSPRFVAWLSILAGIPDLIADPSLEGGGMHQSARNGFLNIHADFTMHHHHRDWRRRVNLILYLNEGWQSSWGGAIELWNVPMDKCVVKIDPLINHALIFSTDETSYHGFPDRLTCPEGITRKSLALYYYTVETKSARVPQSTDYRARPCDSMARSALIWLDKLAVHLYSEIKSRLALSDTLASRALGLFKR